MGEGDHCCGGQDCNKTDLPQCSRMCSHLTETKIWDLDIKGAYTEMANCGAICGVNHNTTGGKYTEFFQWLDAVSKLLTIVFLILENPDEFQFDLPFAA